MDRPNKSEANEIQRKPTPGLEILDQRELQAVQLRYCGKTSTEIAEVTGYNENYVRNLFMSGGRLEKAYKDFAYLQQKKAHGSVDIALNRAMEEAALAIERIIALSRDAENEAAILKANEYLLNIAGINSQTTLRSLLQNKSYDQAKAMIVDMFNELYQQPFERSGFTVVLSTNCEHCGNSTSPVNLNGAIDEM